MARLTKLKTKTRGAVTEVLVRVDHPMENGRRQDHITKQTIPEHYIQRMIFALNGNNVATANLGPAVSKNPLTAISIKGAKPGDAIKVAWTDNMGETGGAQAIV